MREDHMAQGKLGPHPVGLSHLEGRERPCFHDCPAGWAPKPGGWSPAVPGRGVSLGQAPHAGLPWSEKGDERPARLPVLVGNFNPCNAGISTAGVYLSGALF